MRYGRWISLCMGAGKQKMSLQFVLSAMTLKQQTTEDVQLPYKQRKYPKSAEYFKEILEDKSYDSYYLKIMTTLLGPVTTFIKPADLEKELFVIFLPSVNSAFDSALDEVVSLLERNSDFEEENAIHLSKYLQLCLNVIDVYYELVGVLGKLKNLEAGNASTLMKSLPCVLKTVFLHCYGSEELYGCYFSDSTTLLSALFLKSYQLYLNFCKLLESSVSFQLNFEEDVVSLVQITESMSSINDVVIKLDVKATALVWKHFAAIICKYSSDLKERLNMEKSVTCLCGCITETIARLHDVISGNNDDKARETMLKLGNFLLKILIKLCGLYESYLDDSFQPIFDVLVKLCSCSRTPGLKCKEREELNRFISIASAALIKTILSEDQFRKVVEERLEESFERDKLGTFFLTIILMRKICQEIKKNEKWFSFSFVQRVINFYDGCGPSIDGNSVTEGTNTYFFIVYTIGLFILAPSYSSYFGKTEKFLVQKLVAQNIDTAVLSSDIITFICKHSSEDYCCDVASALWKYLVSWTSSQWRPEYIVIGCTFKRLFDILSSAKQQIFCSDDPELIRWSGIRQSQSSVTLNLNDEASHYIAQVARLSYSNELDMIQVNDFLDLVQPVVNSPFRTKWHENVMVSVFRIAGKIVPRMSSTQREVVFDCLLRSVLNCDAQPSVRLKLAVCRFVASVACHMTMAELTPVLRKFLRSQENTLVFLRAVLLTMSAPSCEGDLSTLSSVDPRVHRTLNLYVEDVLESELVPGAKVLSNVFTHKCIKIEAKHPSPGSEPVAKKIKMSEVSDSAELSLVISRLKDDLSNIKRLILNDASLSSEVKDMISLCSKDFEFIRGFL